MMQENAFACDCNQPTTGDELQTETNEDFPERERASGCEADPSDVAQDGSAEEFRQ